jgi:hypothetical protein
MSPPEVAPTVLVCAECRAGIEEFGATVDVTPRTVTPGHQCETHPTRVRAQACHAMAVTADMLQGFAASWAGPSPVDRPEPGEDVALVATLAATLAAGCGEPFSDDLALLATQQARTLIRAAKGQLQP